MKMGDGDICIFRNIHFDIKPEYIDTWELGRQNALYTKRLMQISSSVKNELDILFPQSKKLDAWHLKIQSNIPLHKDPVNESIQHYRYNICHSGDYWFNLKDRTFLLTTNDVVLFRSDISDHGIELFEKNLVEIFSFGIFIERGTS